jgi:5'(3')-deoxyribonucleotidase
MSVAIDFDGVLCDTVQKWIQIFHTHYSKKYDNLQLSYSKITQWDFYQMYDITHEDSRQIFQQCWESWDTLHPTEFMLSQKIETLSKLCGKIDIVTANEKTNQKYLEKFLHKYDIKYSDIIFEENKEKLNYDIFIDDSPINAQKIFDSGSSVLLYNQPWNVNIISKEKNNVFIHRVYSLDHAIHILQNK